jgi:hypothetical protein
MAYWFSRVTIAGLLVAAGAIPAVLGAAAENPPPAHAPGFIAKLKYPGRTNNVHGPSFTQDGTHLAIITNPMRGPDRLLVWDLPTGKVSANVQLSSTVGGTQGVALWPDGTAAVTVAMNHNLSLWNVASGQLLYTRGWNGKEIAGQSLILSPDGKTACASVQHEGMNYANHVTFWETASGQVRRRLFSIARKESGWAYTFSPDGRYLLVSYERDIRLFDLVSGKTTPTYERFKQATLAAAFSPDGLRLALVGSDVFNPRFSRGQPNASLSLHEVHTGKTLFRVPSDDDEQRVTFCLDGRVVATAGDRSPNIRLWHAGTGELLYTLRGDSRWGVGGLACSPDGKHLASLAFDGVLLWDLTAINELQNLKPLPPIERSGAADGEEKPLSAAELNAFWDDLGGSDGVKAYDAIGELVLHPKTSVPFLREHLKPILAPDAERVKKLLRDLDSDDFETRTQAQQQLTEMAWLIASQLRQVREKTNSAEVKRSLGLILESVEPMLSDGAKLRPLRVIEALERAGTSDALDVLRDLSKGHADVWQTQDAKLALERLTRRRAFLARGN